MERAALEKRLFQMEALWSRCFPVDQELKKGIDSKEFGEVKLVQASMCVSDLNDNRYRTDLAECPLNDIGVYVVQFALFVFGEKPDYVHIEGQLDKSKKCDVSGNITLLFRGGRGKAFLVYSSQEASDHAALVSCEKGMYKIPEFFNAPSKLLKIKNIDDPDEKPEIFETPLQDDQKKYNFGRSEGLHYEADHVFECLNNGKTESPIASLDDSLMLAEVVDTLRAQLGIKFPHDEIAK
jgi:dihydrodiol dehydrogenase / D-xylose 1-dehydrogenase (NADP)